MDLDHLTIKIRCFQVTHKNHLELVLGAIADSCSQVLVGPTRTMLQSLSQRGQVPATNDKVENDNNTHKAVEIHHKDSEKNFLNSFRPCKKHQKDHI